jgi:hypothetical protein
MPPDSRDSQRSRHSQEEVAVVVDLNALAHLECATVRLDHGGTQSRYPGRMVMDSTKQKSQPAASVSSNRALKEAGSE